MNKQVLKIINALKRLDSELLDYVVEDKQHPKKPELIILMNDINKFIKQYKEDFTPHKKQVNYILKSIQSSMELI